VDAAGGDRFEGLQRHVLSAAQQQQQQLQHRGLRKLRPARPAAEAPVASVEALRQLRHRPIERRFARELGRSRQQRAAGQALAQALAPGADLISAVLPRLGDRLQHLRPRR